MIYLASPYSHDDPAVMEQRFHDVCKVTAQLIKAGLNVFSPIAHSHPLVEYGAPTDWKSWERVDLDILGRCDGIAVLELEGFSASVGVHAEVKFAKSIGMKVMRFSPLDPMEQVAEEWEGLFNTAMDGAMEMGSAGGLM